MRTATSGATGPKGGGQRASCAACADEGPSRPPFLPFHAYTSGRSGIRGLGPVSSVIWSTVTLPAEPRHETNACAGSFPSWTIFSWIGSVRPVVRMANWMAASARSSPVRSRGSSSNPARTRSLQRPSRQIGEPAKGRNLSPLSHGLTGRYGTMASTPDTRQYADLRIRIPTH